jgi:membrane-bound ClpP family serine protease
MAISSIDVFVGVVLCLALLRFNAAVNGDLFSPNLIKLIKEDAFLTTVGLFALLYLASGQNVVRSIIGVVLISVAAFWESKAMLYVMGVLLIVLGLAALYTHHFPKQSKRVAVQQETVGGGGA